jgi:dimethylsulfone monooxygenase
VPGASGPQPPLRGALGNANRLKLGTFSTNLDGGGAITTMEGILHPDWPRVRAIAQTADRMGLELFVPVARWKGYGGVTNYAGPSFDTFCWAAGLAAVTEQAYIFSTCHVPTMHPIVAAKQLTTIDHISGGRSGLNIVGGWFRPELEMFGRELLEHDRRYDMAEEWTEILLSLWREREEFDYKGEFFTVNGGYSEPKPLQQPRPPIMNAGGSGRGMDFAARNCDVLFAYVQDDEDLSDAKAAVDRVKDLAQSYGRSVQVWTQAYVVCRETEAEARAFYEHYVRELGDFDAADRLMHFLGLESEVLGPKNYERARERFMAGWGGVGMVGTPEQIVERFVALADAGYAGCVLLFPLWEEGLESFARDVLPLMERAGLREPYTPASA